MRSILFLIVLTLIGSGAVGQLHHANKYNKKGQPQGRWVYYFDRSEGIIQSTGYYFKGKPVGRWMTYYNNGCKQIRTCYFGKQAREVRFHRNGKPEKKGWSRLIFDQPEEIRYYWHGRWRIYNENGKPLRIVRYVDGTEVGVIRNQQPLQ